MESLLVLAKLPICWAIHYWDLRRLRKADQLAFILDKTQSVPGVCAGARSWLERLFYSRQ